MTPAELKKFCVQGERADAFFMNGRYSEAYNTYLTLLEDLEKTPHADSYLAAKLTLGILLTHIKSGRLQEAVEVWNSDMEESLLGIGIYSLENAQTTVDDMLMYDFICAYLHSISDAGKLESAKAINQYLSRVCEHAFDEGNRELFAMAIGNWKIHLRDVFKTALPQAIAAPLIEFEKQFGEIVKSSALHFPRFTSWQKPDDFREMSRVLSFKVAEQNPQFQDIFSSVATIEGATARKLFKK
jgi:hypothetical protein